MGGYESRIKTPDPTQPLVAQSDRLCATKEKYVLEETVQLRFVQEGKFAFELKVIDANTDEIYFQFEKDQNVILPIAILRDEESDEAILRLKRMFRSEEHTFKIYSGKDISKQVCIVDTPTTRSVNNRKRRIGVHFKDALVGCPRFVVLEGDWDKKNCFFYNGEPKLGGEPIAKISLVQKSCSCGRKLEKDFVLDVAPGVDIALIATMSVAFMLMNLF